jgi:hypothetical protein
LDEGALAGGDFGADAFGGGQDVFVPLEPND